MPSCFSEWLYHFAFPPKCVSVGSAVLASPRFSPSLVSLRHSTKYVVVFGGGFNFISLMTNDMELLSLCFLPSIYFFDEVYVQIFSSFLNPLFFIVGFWVSVIIYKCLIRYVICKNFLPIMDFKEQTVLI